MQPKMRLDGAQIDRPSEGYRPADYYSATSKSLSTSVIVSLLEYNRDVTRLGIGTMVLVIIVLLVALVLFDSSLRMLSISITVPLSRVSHNLMVLSKMLFEQLQTVPTSPIAEIMRLQGAFVRLRQLMMSFTR